MNKKKPIGFSAALKFLTPLILSILSSAILVPMQSAFADSYSNGYSEGCSDAGRDRKGLNGHGYDETVHHGDSQFQSGYVNGYRACWNGGDNQSTPPATDREPDRSSDKSQTRGINWMPICTKLQPALYSSCGSLVNDDGSLTSEGTHAMHCIRNGALLALGAGLSSISPSLIIGGLQILEGRTGCAGIVNWDILNTIGTVGKILNLIP